MLHYSDAQRFRQSAQPPSALAQSAFDLLLGMRGVTVTLLFLDLSDPTRPVAEVPGFVEKVDPGSLTVGLAAPLPRLGPRTRFGVEIMAGPGILRFQTEACCLPEQGTTRVQLGLPRQIESVQRRKFSRVKMAAAVAFSPILSGTESEFQQGGVGQSMDLSAGGLRFVTQSPARFGQLLFLSFNTPDGTTFRGLQGRVTRVQNDGGRYTVALQFIDLDGAVADQLVHTVFRLQLKGLAKH